MMKLFFQQYLFLLDREAKKALPALLLIFFSSSILDIISIGLVGAFLLLVINFNHVIYKLPVSIRAIFNHFSQNEIIFFIGASLVFAFIFKGFWGIYSQKKLIYFTSQFNIRLKMRLMSGYQNAAYLFHLKQNSAFLINKLALASSFSNSVLSPSLNMIYSLFIVFSLMSCLAIVHPAITLFLLIMVALIFGLYGFFFKNTLVKMSKILATASGEINKSVLQALGGMKEIRVLGREPFFLNKVNAVSQEYSYATSIYASLQLIPRYAVESGASIFLVSLILGAILFGASSLNMIPVLGIFATACIKLLPAMSQLIGQFSQLRGAVYGVGLLYDEIDALENKYKTTLNEVNSQNRHFFSKFSLSHVSFSYEHAKNNALNNIDLTIDRGQSIGLMGSSGAGKSTLVSIILGLLSPDSGKLLVDGLPVENLREWLNNFAYIPQSIFLLDDTLKHNIAMGTEDKDINYEKLNKAIDMAQLSEVVADLPEGANTLIGENGVRLSGGQRQRVALARAFYYEREIIIMDEATSSLDNETEHEVINSIKKLHGIKTLIVIAHRLSTIQHCDIIYKLEKGKIIAQGSFDEVVGNQESVVI